MAKCKSWTVIEIGKPPVLMIEKDAMKFKMDNIHRLDQIEFHRSITSSESPRHEEFRNFMMSLSEIQKIDLEAGRVTARYSRDTDEWYLKSNVKSTESHVSVQSDKEKERAIRKNLVAIIQGNNQTILDDFNSYYPDLALTLDDVDLLLSRITFIVK